MFTDQVTIRVRYAETDQMGYVYYGNYAAWFEVGRVEALRKLGIAYRDLEDAGVMLPVTDYSVSYLRPVRYDDEVIIETRITEMPGARIHFEYTCSIRDTEVTRAETTLFFMNRVTGKPMRCPEELSSALHPYFQNEASEQE